MPPFDAVLEEHLAALREQGLYRQLRRVDSPPGPRLEFRGGTYLNFSSNDYLGFASHPALKESATAALEKFGAGSGASRLICGSLAPFHRLEEGIAAFKKTEAALTFATGYAAAFGAITSLVGKDDILMLDKLAHACIVDAARLSGAKLRVFDHNDLNDLEDKLKWANARLQSPAAEPSPAFNLRHPRRVLIVTESIFSMDGDAAPLREIAALKEKYGAWLMLDEAHATGIAGEQGRGLADALGVSRQVEIQMGTLSKAVGASGGFICGSRALVDYLVNRARSFIFSTAPPPAAAAAASAAIELIQSVEGESRRNALRQRVAQLHASRFADQPIPAGAIIPLILGAETKASAAADQLREQGCFVPAIRYPSVARGAARLRITLTSSHSANQVAKLAGALDTVIKRMS